jgi:hypothetical protein
VLELLNNPPPNERSSNPEPSKRLHACITVRCDVVELIYQKKNCKACEVSESWNIPQPTEGMTETAAHHPLHGKELLANIPKARWRQSLFPEHPERYFTCSCDDNKDPISDDRAEDRPAPALLEDG